MKQYRFFVDECLPVVVSVLAVPIGTITPKQYFCKCPELVLDKKNEHVLRSAVFFTFEME